MTSNRTTNLYWPGNFRTLVRAALMTGLGMSIAAIPARATSSPVVGLAEYTSVSGAPQGNSIAIYDSSAFGGDYGTNVGLSVTLGDPTAALTTSPKTMPAGLLNGSLNLTAVGSQAFVGGGLSTAGTRISLVSGAGNPGGPIETEIVGNATLADGLTFHVAGGGPINIGVEFKLTGSATVPTDGSYSQTILMDLGSAQLQWAAASPNPRSVIESGTENWTSYTTPTNTPYSLDFIGMVSVNSEQDLQFLLEQGINCNVGANCGFTAKVTFILPAGVTFTSDSGVFLTPPGPRDFAGDGLSGELLYDPSNGQSYTALSNGDGTYQYVPNLFTSDFDTLRTGDYNGDGKADLILYNSHTAVAYIGFGNGDGTFNFQSLFWSPAYDTVSTGDINGDGKTDVALYNSATGTLYTGISNGDGTFAYLYHLVSSEFTFVALADFAGSGKAGLLLYNSQNGLAFLGVGDGTGNFTFNPLSISAGYNLGAVGDLNGDGKADIILYNGASGNAATGISNGSGGFTFTPLNFSPGFTSVHLGDYTGDGKASVTVYNKNNAAAYFGTGNGDGTFTFVSLFWSPGYDNVLIGDVNGNGKTDVILYNSATGTEYSGLSNGNGTFSYTYSYWGLGKLLAP